ncbi:DUF4913 domain-containing protein [Terracoccus luteus]|uniref:DUF4913 domain-containing protein n=1 Tax=Terracoccus luteus TaxID=53356 RepID=UPI001C84263F
MWRAWEALRLDPATGMSVWWRDHADHHMTVLFSPEGPFAGAPDSPTSCVALGTHFPALNRRPRCSRTPERRVLDAQPYQGAARVLNSGYGSLIVGVSRMPLKGSL